MLEDKLLIYKLKNGKSLALQRIYEKYKNDLLALALALSNNKAAAEDVVHDVFVSFARIADNLQLRTSLKSYLAASVANRVRNLGREKPEKTAQLNEAEIAAPDISSPERLAISKELTQSIGNALEKISYEQREVIILHLQSGLKFSQIAKSQDVSLNTIQSRYRYGLNKLQAMLDGEVIK